MKSSLARAFECPHFKNPPIVEAVIAIDVVELPESVVDQFYSLSTTMQQFGYNVPSPVFKHFFEMKINAGDSAAETRDTAHGLRFDSSDGLHAVQFTRTGFIFSRLGKYDRWESFRDEAKRLWDLYRSEVGLAELKDYGVRYINKVFVPMGEEISSYLQIYPYLPSDLSRSIHECFMRLGMPIEQPQGRLVHQQILLPQEKENFATLLLDNDFRFSAIGLTAEDLWRQLEKVRKIKDEYFCKFITKRLMETFDA